MTVFEILLIVTLLAILTAIVIIGIKGSITIRIVKHNITENKIDPIQLEIAKHNLEELKKYNTRNEEFEKDKAKQVKSIAESVQALLGVETNGSEE